MPKKKSSKQRTEVKDLPKKSKKLSAKDMKKVKGGAGSRYPLGDIKPEYPDPPR